MLFRLAAALIAVCFVGHSLAWSEKKQKSEEEEEVTQVLDVPKDPPPVAVGEADRLVFFNSPLSAKGLLSQQMKDAVKSVRKQLRKAQAVRIRAFVSGSADLRRVPAIISEEFTDKRLQIPAVTVVQVGALPLTGAQVQLEAIAVDRKVVNPGGVAFVSGQGGKASDPVAPLQAALGQANLPLSAVRRVTCFLNALEYVESARAKIAASFPKVPATFVQLRRDSMGDFVECEAVASLSTAPQKSPAYIGKIEDRYSQIVMVGPERIAFTGMQLAFGREEADVRLAFDRIGKTLESAGAGFDDVVMSNVYPLSNSMSEQVRKIRTDYYSKQEPPASTLLLFEGLPSLDASFGVELAAVAK